MFIQSCSVTHSEVLEFTALERTFFLYFWEFKLPCGWMLMYCYIYSWEMVVPDMFGPVDARAEGVVFAPSAARHFWELKKWLWWLWRVSHCSGNSWCAAEPWCLGHLWIFVVLTNTCLTLPEVRQQCGQTMQCMTLNTAELLLWNADREA